MESKRLAYPDLLRIISIFFVILIHVTSPIIETDPIGSSSWIIGTVINSISRWAVPVFFMISGMFFLDPDKEFNIKEFYKKHVLKMIITIVIVGFLYGLLDQYLYRTLSLKSIAIAAYYVVTGQGGYHMWFLYVLVILYIETPLLRILTKNASKKELEYTLVLWFIFSICIPQLNLAARELYSIEKFLPWEPMNLVGYSGFYLLGYYLKQRTISKRTTIVVIIFSLIVIVTVPSATVITGIQSNINTTWAMSTLGIGSTFLAIMTFELSKKIVILPKSVHLISKNVFGIYLIHPAIIYLINKYISFSHTTSRIFLTAVLVYIVSFIIVAVLSQFVRLLNARN